MTRYLGRLRSLTPSFMRAVLIDVDNRAEIECVLSPNVMPLPAIAQLQNANLFYLEYGDGANGKTETICGIWPPPHWPAAEVAQIETALGIHASKAVAVDESPYRLKRMTQPKRGF